MLHTEILKTLRLVRVQSQDPVFNTWADNYLEGRETDEDSITSLVLTLINGKSATELDTPEFHIAQAAYKYNQLDRWYSVEDIQRDLDRVAASLPYAGGSAPQHPSGGLTPPEEHLTGLRPGPRVGGLGPGGVVSAGDLWRGCSCAESAEGLYDLVPPSLLGEQF